MGLLSNEAGRFLGGYSMSKDNMQQTIGGLCDAWDGKPIRYDVIRDEAEKPVYGTRLSIHWSTQPDIGLQLLNNPTAQHMGLLSRFLIAYPESTIGTRFRAPVSLEKDPNLHIYTKHITELLNKPLPWDPDIPKMLKPRVLAMTKPAQDVWWRFHCEVERDMGSVGRYATMKHLVNKMPQNAARVAAVFTILENPDARDLPVETMNRAVEIIRFYLGEAERLCHAATAEPVLVKAQNVLNILKKERVEKFYPAMLYHGEWDTGLRDKKSTMLVIDALMTHGLIAWIESQEERIIDDAPRREAWRVL